MPTVVQFRRGTTSQNNAFTGALGELSIDTQLDTIRVHDGSTAGGYELVQKAATQTLTNKTINLTSNTLSTTLAQLNTAISDADVATLDGAELLSNKTFTLAQSGGTSAYATKRVLQYNESTGAVTYSNKLDAVSPYITGYGSEIHVSPVALDNSGNGTIGDPVKTIAQALVLAAAAFETTAAGSRKTIILHPGDYSENVTINTQFTVLASHELVGKNTTISGTVTLTKGCTVDGLKMTNLVISADDTTGSVDIIGCTVTTAVTKTSSAYTVLRGCDLSSASLSITGSGSTVMVGGNYGTVATNNASAGVLAKAVITMGPVTLTAGVLQLSDTLIYSATNTSNAITQSAGSFLTVNNCQTLIPALTNVSRNSFGGFYSILHSVYDKANSTFGGTSLNAISYSQYINADRLTLNGVTSGATIINATAAAGTTTLTLPAATDTLVGKATTDTLTNKTFNTAATGNVFQINGTGITAVTGTGSAVLAASPALTGTATAVNLTLSGDLTVNGTTTTINSTTLTVDDKNIELGSVDTPTNTTADGGGITLKGATDKTLNWLNATGAWTSSEDFNLVTGKAFKINDVSVLSSTTLGTGITASSLTSFGASPALSSPTLTTATLSGNTSITGHLLPTASITYDLGSASNRFRDLYLAGTTIYLGTTKLMVDANGDMVSNKNSAASYPAGSNVAMGGGVNAAGARLAALPLAIALGG